MFSIIPIVNAESSVCEIVIDFKSGRVLYQNNCDEKRNIASITKILTCITTIENCDINKTVVIKKEWTGIEGSSIYLREGETFTIEELLYGLMLRSGNDAATAIACFVSGDFLSFSKLMNETASKAGAINSSFKNPHGLDEEGHYSTAFDLALITKYAMENAIFRKIVSTKRIVIGKGESARILTNKNKLLFNYENCIGVKTGYTKKSGRCLVSSAKKNDAELICVVLNCGPMYERSEELLKNTFEEYDWIKIVDATVSVCELKTKNGNSVPCYVKEDIFYPVKVGDVLNIKYEIELNKMDYKIAKFGQECGTIKIFNEKQLLFVKKIYTIIS